MAERSSKRSSSAPVTRKKNSITDSADGLNKVEHSPDAIPECAVCLQTCNHPVKLPCSHIFCFLCVKGAANQSRRCALCRQAIPIEFFSNPTLISKKDESAKEPEPDAETEHYSWFYEGRNGWWQYDERTNVELEESYNAKKRTFELLIAGYMYVIDLDNMVQMRRNDPSRRRRIKRDLVSAPKKGIAGLKIAVRSEGTATTAEDRETAELESDGTAAGGVPSKQSGTGLNAVSVGNPGRTKSRTAGVGRDHADANPSSVPLDQYDADDDYDGTDTDDEADKNVQWAESRHGPAQRSRPERPGRRAARDARADAPNSPHSRRQPAASSARSNPQGLPIRHQRVRSAPETRPGRPDQPAVTSSRRVPWDSSGVDQQEERVDPASVDSSMRSLNLSTPDDSVYEVTAAPVQPPQGEIRQRRRRRQNDDVEL